MDDWVLAENMTKTKYTVEELEHFRKEKKEFKAEKKWFYEEIEESEDEGLEQKE